MSDAQENDLTLEVCELSKSYPDAGGGTVNVLTDINLSLLKGTSAAIIGPSGCGKTTLLNVIGTLDTPTAGSIKIAGQNITTLNEKQRAALRAKQIGFVFQEHHLLPQCTALENTLIPTLADGIDRKGKEHRATELLKRVGLSDRMNHRPDALSGGQRQRVAIVRALINSPALLLVDEPTGALDGKTAGQIMDLLIELNHTEQTAMLMVTHAPDLASRLDQTLRLDQGQLTAEAMA